MYPFVEAHNIISGGHPYSQVSFTHFPLCITRGGMTWPQAFAKVSMVLVSQCSEDPWQFTFSPHTPITSSSLGTSFTSDSSQFHMYKGELMLYSSHIPWYSMKKLAIVIGLANMAQLTDMFLTCFSFKIGFLVQKCFQQFWPAQCFVGEKPGMLLKCTYSHARLHNFLWDKENPDLAKVMSKLTRSFSSSGKCKENYCTNCFGSIHFGKGYTKSFGTYQKRELLAAPLPPEWCPLPITWPVILFHRVIFGRVYFTASAEIDTFFTLPQAHKL